MHVAGSSPWTRFEISNAMVGRIAERAHRVLHGGRRVEALRDRGDRGVRAVVVVVHVVEHFLATVVLEVDVDVRRLGFAVDARLGEKALEEEAVLHRIDGGDAEAERHRRVGGAAAPLAENALVPREADGVGHHEKESREAEARDELQLVIDLVALLRRRFGPALAHPVVGPASKRDVVVDVGETSGELGFAKVGQGRAHPVEREPGALLGDADGLAEPFLASLPSLGHLLRRKETPLAVRMEQPARGGVVDREIVAQRGEHVVDETTRLVRRSADPAWRTREGRPARRAR